MFFISGQYPEIFPILLFFIQIPLETSSKMVYNRRVYPQFSLCAMKPLGQMRGNDNHECIQQEKAP